LLHYGGQKFNFSKAKNQNSYFCQKMFFFLAVGSLAKSRRTAKGQTLASIAIDPYHFK